MRPSGRCISWPAWTLPAERKALLFSAGGVRLALRLIAPARGGRRPVRAPARSSRSRRADRGRLRLDRASGCPAAGTPLPCSPRVRRRWRSASSAARDRRSRRGGVLPAPGPHAPARSPRPSPGAVVHARRGRSRARAGDARERALRARSSRARARRPTSAFTARARALLRPGRVHLWRAAPAAGAGARGPALPPVPLAAPSHRGLLYHGRALHPVFDVAVRYGDPPGRPAAIALLIDAGGEVVAVLADRVVPPAEAGAREVVRPSWDALFCDLAAE